MEADPCASKVLAALNQVFRTDILETCVVWGESGLHGGAYNVVLDIRWTDEHPDTVRVFNALSAGRYRLSGWKNIAGFGRHLHIPSGGEIVPLCNAKVPFQKFNDGGNLRAVLTAHIDDFYPYSPNPVGFLGHVIRDVAMSKTRNPCP